MRSREVIKLLEDAGWRALPRTATSHIHFTHPDHPHRVTVPHPVKELPIGTIKAIERSSGVKLRRR